MYIIYSALLALALLLSLPYWLVRMARAQKYRAGLGERLGRYPRRLRRSEPNEDCIWVHAVSVGEVLAVQGLLQGLREKYPKWRIVLSTTTATGHALAEKQFTADEVFYLPLDFRFALRPYFERLRPRLLVIAETEFWPNLLQMAWQSGARVAVVNARISDRSLPRYRMFRGLLRCVLKNVDLFAAQSEEDRRRLLAIGAAAARVQVAGNLKYDIARPAANEFVERARGALGRGLVLVAGSTVEGEEAAVLAAFARVREQHANAVLILAPRHPERFNAVAQMTQAIFPNAVRRSHWQGEPLAGGVLLLDTIGELAATYELATIAFVGGSMVPRGGHNILEPAQFGKAIVTGPHMENFREMAADFRGAGALETAHTHDLGEMLLALLADPARVRAMGEAARAAFERNSGATARTLDALQTLLWMPETLRSRYGSAGDGA